MQDETFMKSATIVFPHQLFEVHPACAQGRDVFLIEEYLYFSQYRFHKQKISFHRASMKFYEHYLSEQLYPVHYIEADDERADCRNLILQIFIMLLLRMIGWSEEYENLHHNIL
jgi:deoxyribodipyrimidine photolyase-related protein